MVYPLFSPPFNYLQKTNAFNTKADTPIAIPLAPIPYNANTKYPVIVIQYAILYIIRFILLICLIV